MSASTVPVSSMYTYLMYRTTTNGDYAKLCDIKTCPDLGSEPEQIDVTTLSDDVRKFAPGVQNMRGMAFGANYISSDFNKIQGLSGHQYQYAVWLGASSSGGVDTPDGSNGKWDWTGDIYVYKDGANVNAPQDMTIIAFPSTKIGYTV